MCERKRFNVEVTITVLLAVLGVCGTARGKIIYVDTAAVGENNGSSWADAYNYLQDALIDANAAAMPVQIHVAQGLYRPDQGTGVTPGSASATFRLTDGMILRGGFAGVGAADPDARSFEIYQTVLSGDLLGDDVDAISPPDLQDEPTRTDNSRTLIKMLDSEATIELDGFTLTAARRAIENLRQGNISVSNCVLKGFSGDAIRSHRGELKIAGCTFEDNWRQAIHHWGDDLTVTNSLFDNNWGFGGMINCHSHSNKVTMRDCTFTGNVATGGRGMIDCHAENLTLYNCTFSGNFGPRVSCVDAWADELVAENCTFTGNTGNVIELTLGRLVISNCLFAGNRGKAIDTRGLYAKIRNCTFSDNHTDTAGSALDLRREHQVSNSIIWGNSSPAIEIWPSYAELVVEYCNVQGGLPGIGNIDVDPGFVSPGYWELNGTPDDPNDDFWVDGDYRLLSQAGRWDAASGNWVQDDATSPCIDAGDPNGPMGPEPFPNGGQVNMGAYGAGETAGKTYFGGPVCDVILAGDINGDCVVDFDDLAILMSQWMMRGEDFINKPPVVTLIAPQDGDQITWPGPTIFRAEAHDPDGQVISVSFVIQQRTETSSRTRGFGGHEGANGWEDEFDWQSSNEFNAGNWTAWAEATDNEGQRGVSPSIVITLHRP